MDIRDRVLMLLDADAKLSVKDIALRLGENEERITKIIDDMEREKIILGYRTLINWDQTNKDFITALIEVRLNLQRGQGFDIIAERIYNFPEVKDCFLVSGGFDLLVVIEGKTLKEVALFVSDRIATLESVASTHTHFILKKYKSNGLIYAQDQNSDREAIVL
jgi:DNA-binding Lrp family transcriptional regulator